jgi:ABC-type transport system involved in multi-copper enzyme maturation permease subunit
MNGFLILAQSEKVVGWLTPVWLLSMGITLGMICLALLWLVINGLARIPLFNRLYDDPVRRRIASIVIGLVALVGLGVVGWLNGVGRSAETVAGERQRQLILFGLFAVASAAIIGCGLIPLLSRRRLTEIRSSFSGSLVQWIFIVGIVAVAFFGVGTATGFLGPLGVPSFVEAPGAYFRSLAQWPQAYVHKVELEVPAMDSAATGMVVPFGADAGRLRSILVRSNQRLEIAARPIDATLSHRFFWEIPGDPAGTAPFEYRPQPEDAVFSGWIENVYVVNRGNGTADVEVRWQSLPEHPEIALVPRAAIWITAVVAALVLLMAVAPRITAIASATFKTEISQPLFLILLVIGGIFFVASVYIPYNTFGEDIKMYQDSGLTLLRVLGIFLAIWAASKSVAEEIEGRTALTVLSKPIGRRQFVIGKFVGIVWAIALLFIVLGLWCFVWTSYKFIYDAVETSVRNFDWQLAFVECVKVLPGLLLAFFEAVVFVAISVAISTRMGILANIMICFAIYVLGHLTPQIVQSATVVEALEFVVFFGQAIAIVVPVLDHFDVQAAIVGDAPIPLSYVGWSAVYTALYGSIAILLACVLFEDRDLA